MGTSAPEHLLNRLNEYADEYEIGKGDAFWLVSDCDHWVQPNQFQNLTQVLQQCRQKSTQVALSNPCFDLWLLLHFTDFPAEDILTCNEVAAGSGPLPAATTRQKFTTFKSTMRKSQPR